MPKLDKIVLFTVLTTSSLILLAIILPSIGVFSPLKQKIEEEWWRKYPIYIIHPRAFFDLDGDIREFKGNIDDIIAKIPYLNWLGVKTLWLLPFYQSPVKDAGYDISNQRQTAGPMDGFRKLVHKLKEKGMYLVISLVPSYTSTSHVWFERSQKNVGLRTSDYYIWSTIPWSLNQSQEQKETEYHQKVKWIFGESRSQYYLSLGVNPALNYRNLNVRAQMLHTIKFWLDKGVDGIVFDDFYDARKAIVTDFLSFDNEYEAIDFDYSLVLREWSEEIKLQEKITGRPLLSAIKMAYPLLNGAEVSKAYSDSQMDIVLNTDLTRISKLTKMTSYIHRIVHKWNNGASPDLQSNWLISDLHISRPTSRMGNRKFAGVLNMLTILLPGPSFIFYGDELGLEDQTIQWQNLTSHNVEPMPWNAHINPKTNIRSQMNDKFSHLSLFKSLLQLHKNISVDENAQNMSLITTQSEEVVAFRRFGTTKDFLVVLNFGTSGFHALIDISSQIKDVVEGQIYFACG